MATIDKLDIGIYIQYAKRTQMIEQLNQQYHVTESRAVPTHAEVVDIYPRMSELDMLLGIVPRHAPWALFSPPKKFRKQRKSPFAFGRVITSLGSDEEREEDERKLLEQDCDDEDEKKEQKVLLNCLKQVGTINDWMSFIVGRVGQFLQG